MDLAEAMQARIDRDMAAMFTGGATANAATMEPFTFDKLREAMALLEATPPPPVFASSESYPMDDFWQFERGGRDYVLGHPSLWAKIPAEVVSGPPRLASIPIVNVDDPRQDELRGKIRFWIATASHRPGEPPKWPKSVSVRSRTPPGTSA